MRVTVTVDLEVADKTEGRRVVEAAGFTVTRVTAKRGPSSPTPASRTLTTTPNRFQRADAALDMPDGLTAEERRAYVRGYANGCLRYVRKHGAAVIRAPRHYGEPDEDGYRPVQIGPDEIRRLATLTREHEWERHPTAHKAGLAELRRYASQHPVTRAAA